MKRLRAPRVLAKIGALGAVSLVAAYQVRRRHLRRSGRRFRYDRAYRENVVLRNGAPVCLRLVRPGDKRLLVRGLAGLSADSRYLRFHSVKQRFTEEELRYLTELDNLDRVAIGARARRSPREGMGVARFVRLADPPNMAEAAVVVREDARRNGLGAILLLRLIQAARERGIRRLRYEVLSVNQPMLSLLRRIAPDCSYRRDGALTVIEMPV